MTCNTTMTMMTMNTFDTLSYLEGRQAEAMRIGQEQALREIEAERRENRRRNWWTLVECFIVALLVVVAFSAGMVGTARNCLEDRAWCEDVAR